MYKLQKRANHNPDFTLENSLFGPVQITKDVNVSLYKYSGYSISFDSGGSFSFGSNNNARYVIIFACDMSFSTPTNSRVNNIYVLGKDFIQGINETTVYAEKLYKTDFTKQNKKFVLRLHYNGDNSYLFVNGLQQLKFKTKDTEIKRVSLSLGNINTQFRTANQTKTGLYGNVYDFAVDYVAADIKQTNSIHRYLMKKKTILYKLLRLIKKYWH